MGVDYSKTDLPTLAFINNTIYFLLLVFSGANVPLANFPVWIQRAAHLLPLTRGIQAAREIIAGANLLGVWPLLAGEILIGIVYVFDRSSAV